MVLIDKSVFNVEWFVDGNLTNHEGVKCPVCDSTLNISHQDHTALCKGDHNHNYGPHLKRSLLRHCLKEHRSKMLWPCIDTPRLTSPVVNSLSLAQNLIFIGFKDLPPLNMRNMQLDLTYVLGAAVGNLASKKRELVLLEDQDNKEKMFQETEEILTSIKLCFENFDWDIFLASFESSFSLTNFFISFVRQGLFFEPEFPALKELGLREADYIHCLRKMDRKMVLNDLPDVSYLFLYYKQMDSLSTGFSTYGEIKRSCVTVMIRKIQELFLVDLNKKETEDFRVLDVGGGLMTTMIHVGQVIPGKYCGIEACLCRSLLFSSGFLNLLKKDIKLINDNIAYVNCDVKEVDIFNFDLVYAFDEAFSEEDFESYLQTFAQSPRAKFLISFKPLKTRCGNKLLLESMIKKYDLIFVSSFSFQMKISNETCNAGFFKKNIADHIKTPKGKDSITKECEKFWFAKNKKGAILDFQNIIYKKIDDEKKGRNKRQKKK